MKRFAQIRIAALTLGVALSSLLTADVPETSHLGFVDFRRCVEESKVGKEQQNSLEVLRNKLASAIEETEKERNELIQKLSDPDYVDSLSHEAEEELKHRFQELSQMQAQRENQFYQILSQEEYKLIQEISIHVARASAIVAKDEGLDLILRNEAAFFQQPNMDVTTLVLSEMNAAYDREAEQTALEMEIAE